MSACSFGRRFGVVIFCCFALFAAARGEESESPAEESELDVNGAMIDGMVNFAKLLTLRGDWWDALTPEVPSAPEIQHALLGQSAPDFELQTLAGESVKLSQFRDKKVVVIDFWATWCGPCRRGLPGIAQLSKNLEKEDVAIFALNLGDSKGDIETFLTDEKLELNVLMDPQSATAAGYQVNAIPCTMVIDQSGTIQVAHIGLIPDLEETLELEIRALLDSAKAETTEAGE